MKGSDGDSKVQSLNYWKKYIFIIILHKVD